MAQDLIVCQADYEYSLTLAELSQCCGVSAEKILVLVNEGVLDPNGDSDRDWVFGGSDLVRARRALRLERDLGINPAGIALVLQLREESKRLHHRVKILEALLFDQ